jgi:hypothetical protein
MPELLTTAASHDGEGAGVGPSASVGTTTTKRGRSNVRSKVDAAATTSVKNVKMVSGPTVEAVIAAAVKKAGKKSGSTVMTLPKAWATSESISTPPIRSETSMSSCSSNQTDMCSAPDSVYPCYPCGQFFLLM